MFHMEHSQHQKSRLQNVPCGTFTTPEKQHQKKQITKCSTWNMATQTSAMFHVEHSQLQKKQESHE